MSDADRIENRKSNKSNKSNKSRRGTVPPLPFTLSLSRAVLLRMKGQCSDRLGMDGEGEKDDVGPPHPRCCASTSYPITAVATAAFRLSARPSIGILTSRSHAAA